MKNLYRFNFDCGRQGELIGVFLAEQKEVDLLIGKNIYFGEVLGKHSEIEGEIEKKEISLITDNYEFLKMAETLNINLESGINPLMYLTCDKCGNVIDIITNKCESCEN